MSSPYRCAEVIIARCTGPVTKPHGGALEENKRGFHRQGRRGPLGLPFGGDPKR
jgi:hypothetical protein